MRNKINKGSRYNLNEMTLQKLHPHVSPKVPTPKQKSFILSNALKLALDFPLTCCLKEVKKEIFGMLKDTATKTSSKQKYCFTAFHFAN